MFFFSFHLLFYRCLSVLGYTADLLLNLPTTAARWDGQILVPTVAVKAGVDPRICVGYTK